MEILERRTQRIVTGKWDEAMAIEKKFEAVEARLGGFPMKRRYIAAFCGLPMDTMVWEREWESMAALEAGYAKYGQDAETLALNTEGESIFLDGHAELFLVLKLS